MANRIPSRVQILDKNLDLVAELRNLYPINEGGMILRYSDELSDYGECMFRVVTRDPVLTEFGDILEPHKYHVRIKRGNATVWQGAIIDNTERNKNYIEVKAAQYEYYLDKILIRRDTTAPTGFNDGTTSWKNYRTFSTGTMKTAVTNIINNAIADFGSDHVLGGMSVGTIENPNYPKGFVDADNNALTGGWTFTDFITLRFDYHTVQYVLEAFGIYTNADFEIDNNLNFNFKKFLGTKQPRLTFEYGTFGNIVDYNLPRLGGRMVNSLWGIGADEDGTILHANQRDEASINTYGLLMGADAYSDVKTQNELKKRMNESLQYTRTPEDSPVNVVLDEKAFPTRYGVGDIITVRVKDYNIDFRKPRRVVGITVTVHNTGRELITVQTNRPRDEDIGSA